MRFIELFAGIGGFRYGLERCMGIESTDKKPEQTELEVQQRRVRATMEMESSILPTDKRWKRSVYTCVWSNEWDKYACQIYRKQFGGEELYEGDITKIDPEDIPDHELLTGGFPCQAFSIAGKRGGFQDTRGTLFFEIAKILQQKQPPYLLLENVKGLLSHENGRTFQTILFTLDELGYDCQWQVLNSKNFGVPQNRERVFIIGHLRGKRRPEVFPIGEECSKGDSIQQEKQSKGKRIQSQDAEEERDWADVESGRARVRRLTPTECERLQGFPDNWTEKGIDKEGNEVYISDTQRYKALGNAVTTNVITAIGMQLMDEVNKAGKE